MADPGDFPIVPLAPFRVGQPLPPARRETPMLQPDRLGGAGRTSYVGLRGPFHNFTGAFFVLRFLRGFGTGKGIGGSLSSNFCRSVACPFSWFQCISKWSCFKPYAAAPALPQTL